MGRNVRSHKGIHEHVRVPESLTTGMVADMLRVAPRTVSKWIDKGLLVGSYRIPGSNDRRVPLGSLLAFCREHGLPDPTAGYHPTVHYVGNPPPALTALGPVETHPDGYSLCLNLPRFTYSVVCLDAAVISRVSSLSLVRALRKVSGSDCWKVLVVRLDDDGVTELEDYKRAGAQAVIDPSTIHESVALLAWGIKPVEARAS